MGIVEDINQHTSSKSPATPHRTVKWQLESSPEYDESLEEEDENTDFGDDKQHTTEGDKKVTTI